MRPCFCISLWVLLCLSIHLRTRIAVSALNTSITPNKAASSFDVYLFSLKWPGDEARSFSKTVRDVWKWKDEVLGDGRDFFVPKPKTLTALQNQLLKSEAIKECSILSNCARFEIIIILSQDVEDHSSSLAARQAISECIAAQVGSHRGTNFLFSRFDWPGAIVDVEAHTTDIDPSAIEDLESHWTQLTGCEAVSRHLCTVAAGMAERPSRPGREVPFRPFSSRDAHVLLQLKRTSEVGVSHLSRSAICAESLIPSLVSCPVLVDFQGDSGESVA